MISGVLKFVVYATCVTFLEAAVWNADPRYTNWDQALGLKDRNGQTNIPVFLEDAAYRSDAPCKTNINDAIVAMNAELAGCINFALMTTAQPTSLNKDFLWISPNYNNGLPYETCSTMPDRNPLQNKQGQKLFMKGGAGGPGTCCADKRSAMRMLALSLGMRNEFNRVDRDAALTVTPGNIDPTLARFGMYNKYTNSAVRNLGRFDMKSITMAQATDNTPAAAVPPVTMYAPVVAANAIGNTPQLSAEDCFHIKAQYGCSSMSLLCDAGP